MRRVLAWVLILWGALALTGCASIPKNGAALSARVSEGIRRNQTETEKIIRALGDVERGILDERWEEIYKKVEDAYRKKHNIATEGQLNFDQRLDVATNAAAVREQLLSEISLAENTLLEQSRVNSQKLLEMNDVVTNYLLSLKNYQEANEAMTGFVSQIIGVDLNRLRGKAEEATKKFLGGGNP